MLNSSNFPISYDDNNIALLMSQPSDHEITPFQYYDRIQSPLFYYDTENYVVELLNNNHDLITMIQQEPLLQVSNNSPIVTTNKMDSITKGDEVVISGMVNGPPVISSIRESKRRMRTSNKDRHSKIRTAHGVRDRRMRLSLEVATQFFELQDMLCYDKASKTVEWLLNQSKIAIDELILSKIGSPSGVTKSTLFSTSDCQGDYSIVVDQKNNNNKGKKSIVKKDVKNNNINIKEKRLRTTKDAMNTAREKARKKTYEKMLSRGMNNK